MENENKKFGVEKKILLLLIHGRDSSKHTWNDFIESFKEMDSVELRNVDIIGHGENSGLYEKDNNYYHVVMNQLKSFIENETANYKELYLLGHSMGARVAMEFCKTFPGTCSRLIIEDMDTRGRGKYTILDGKEGYDWKSEVESREEGDKKLLFFEFFPKNYVLKLFVLRRHFIARNGLKRRSRKECSMR